MNWNTIRRETGLIEHACGLHGVGHPNPASVLRMKWATGQSSWDVHGCCGCCQLPDFPGKVYNNVVYATRLYEEKGLWQYLDDNDETVSWYVAEILDYDDLDEELGEKMRQSAMEFIKLRKYLSIRTIGWHEEFRSGPEFLYWPLCQVLLTDEQEFKDWMKR